MKLCDAERIFSQYKSMERGNHRRFLFANLREHVHVWIAMKHFINENFFVAVKGSVEQLKKKFVYY